MNKPPDPNLLSFNDPSSATVYCINGEVPLASPCPFISIITNGRWSTVVCSSVTPLDIFSLQQHFLLYQLASASKSVISIYDNDEIRLRYYSNPAYPPKSHAFMGDSTPISMARQPNPKQIEPSLPNLTTLLRDIYCSYPVAYQRQTQIASFLLLSLHPKEVISYLPLCKSLSTGDTTRYRQDARQQTPSIDILEYEATKSRWFHCELMGYASTRPWSDGIHADLMPLISQTDMELSGSLPRLEPKQSMAPHLYATIKRSVPVQALLMTGTILKGLETFRTETMLKEDYGCRNCDRKCDAQRCGLLPDFFAANRIRGRAQQCCAYGLQVNCCPFVNSVGGGL